MPAATCSNHPEVKTTRLCQVCQQPFCGACLEPVEAVGPVCASCERLVGEIPLESRAAQLPRIRQEVLASLPAAALFWGWELLYWGVALLPSAIVLAIVLQTLQAQQVMAFLSREPLLPALTTSRLMTVATALESYRLQTGAYPASLDALDAHRPPDQPESWLQDPYAPDKALLRYGVKHEGQPVGTQKKSEHSGNSDKSADEAAKEAGPGASPFQSAGDAGYRVCSLGPDRVFSQGQPLNRMTAVGDLCVGGR